MTQTILAERVYKQRTKKGWSQTELATRLTDYRARLGRGPVRQQSINQVETSDVGAPRYLADLAQVLDVDLAWLLGTKKGTADARLIKVPLISWVQAGGLVDTVDPYIPGDAADWVPTTHKHDHLIALRVRGDSMNRIASDGSVIIVDLNDRVPVDGKHYVFRHDGAATFKTFRAGPPVRLEPNSSDDSFDAIVNADGVEVVGRVIRKSEDI